MVIKDTQKILEYVSVLWIVVSSGFFVLNYVYSIPCILVLFVIAILWIAKTKSIKRYNFRHLMFLLAFIGIDEILTLVLKPYSLSSANLIFLLFRLISLTIIMNNISISSFTTKYINIMVVIALVSILCFAIIQFTPFPLPFCASYQDGFYGSFYFRVNEYTRSVTTRNAGPYGEPGMLAVHIVIALMLQLFTTNIEEIMKKRNSIKISILSIALLTTLSGTGLVCYFVLLIVYTIKNIFSTRTFKNPLIIALIIIMGSGIYYTETTYGILESKVLNQGGSYGVRLNDTVLGYEIAWDNFLTGTGIVNDNTNAWSGALLADSRSNGMANFAAAVGIPFLLYYCYRLFCQGKKLVKNDILYSITFFIVMQIIYNTQPIVFQTLGLSFLLYWETDLGRNKEDD